MSATDTIDRRKESVDDSVSWKSSSISLTGSSESHEPSFSDEEDDDLEPQLKYERLGNDVTAIFKKDAASCIAVNSKFLVLGSHWGTVYVLDHEGNLIRGKDLQAHAISVNQISLDEHGEYLATCSDDGKILVRGFYSTDNNLTLPHDYPIKSIALDPLFYKAGFGRKFLSGDTQLVMHEKTFLKLNRMTVLHEGEGPVQAITWKGHFIAWATEKGVRVYDLVEKRTIGLVRKDYSAQYRSEHIRCHLVWKDELSLFIGWADTVKVCVIRKRTDPHQIRYQQLPLHYVEICSMFTTDFFISGIAPMNDSYLAVLAIPKTQSEVSKAPESEQSSMIVNAALECMPPSGTRPHLKVIEPGQEDYVEISTDVLSLRGYADCKCSDYHLKVLPSEGLYFILAPKDLIVGKPRDEDDHIDWLLEKRKFEEALRCVESNGRLLKRHTLLEVGQKHIAQLISDEAFVSAAALCPKVYGKDRTLWEEEVTRFAKLKQLKTIAPYLPRDGTLSAEVYEVVLFDFVRADRAGFLNLLHVWPKNIYSVRGVLNVISDLLLRDHDDSLLLQALAYLYSHLGEFDKALCIYLKLKHADVFELIERYNLYQKLEDKLDDLMQLDSARAVALLIDHRDKIASETVVERLGGKASGITSHLADARSHFLFLYLDALITRFPAAAVNFHSRLVTLYAEHNREKLLHLLQFSSRYPLQDAFAICQQKNYVPEMVYLLTRMGDTRQALQLTMRELKNIKHAIDFCKECNDQDLWDDLISFSLSDPAYITELLHNIGTHVDPLRLVRRIPLGMEIRGLRDALVKILCDYKLQVSLQEGFQRILVSDSVTLHTKLAALHKRAIGLLDDQICHSCQRRVIVGESSAGSHIIIFFCKHVFHESCLPPAPGEHGFACPLCTTIRTQRQMGFV